MPKPAAKYLWRALQKVTIAKNKARPAIPCIGWWGIEWEEKSRHIISVRIALHNPPLSDEIPRMKLYKSTSLR